MSTIQRAYKTELDLNDEQITACRKHAGAARWAYNWGLARKQECVPRHGDESLGDRVAPRPECAQSDRCALAVCGLQVRAARGAAQPGQAFAHFYRRVQLKQARQTAWEDGVSPAQDQEARTGQLSPHRRHRGLPRRRSVAAVGTAPAQRAWLSADQRQRSSPPPSASRRGIGLFRCWWSRTTPSR